MKSSRKRNKKPDRLGNEGNTWIHSFLTVTACDRVFYKGRALQVVMPLEDGEKGHSGPP